jgi:tetratricopeptide (TPR) repeat protein
MKRLILMGLVLIPGLLFAQKAPKPNINKALTSWKQGKLDEAKEMIDLCAVSEKTMNDGKTWYYKGLIYASLDTTSNEAFQKLSPNALEISAQAFVKAETLKKGNSEYYITDAMGFPVIMTQQLEMLWGYYLEAGVEAYQYEDLEGAYTNFVKCTLIKPKDTTGYFYAALAAEMLEENESSYALLNDYFKVGGNSVDGYQSLYRYYMNKEAYDNALGVLDRAKAIYPNNRDLSKQEIDILIKTERIDQARTKLQDEIEVEPNNTVLHFALGMLNERVGEIETAKENYKQAIKVDGTNYDAAYNLAALFFNDAILVRNEMNKLGNTAADKKKAQELDKILVQKYKDTLPHWQRLEKMKGDECIVLETLANIYYQLGMDKEERATNQKIKMYACDEEE